MYCAFVLKDIACISRLVVFLMKTLCEIERERRESPFMLLLIYRNDEKNLAMAK